MKWTRRTSAALALVVVVVIGAWLVFRSSSSPSDARAAASDPPSASPSVPRAASSTSSSTPPGKVLVTTTKPDEFARAIAAVVFGMDTRDHDGNDYREMLLAEADPMMNTSGLADLTATIDARIPPTDLWARMRANEQWSEWVPTDVVEPGTWQQVVTGGQAEPGWTMRNVMGQETTHYVEAGEAKIASRERTVTIGMRCPAPGAQVDRCRLDLVGTTVVP